MIFDAQAGIIQEIGYLTQFRTVSGPGLIAGMADIGPLLPMAIVYPGEGTLVASSDIMELQTWYVSIIVAHESTDGEHGRTEIIAGEMIDAVIGRLHQRLPSPSNMPMIYRGRPAPIYYRSGWAEFPIRFETHVKLPLDAD